MAADSSGAVYYFDLDDIPGELAPTLLVPAPTTGVQKVAAHLVVDTASAGDAPHYHLVDFTVAVIIACADLHSMTDTHIAVWRVDTQSGYGRQASLRAARCYSYFKDEPVTDLRTCDILGDHLAYPRTIGMRTPIVVVNWKISDGRKPDNLQRTFVPSIPPEVSPLFHFL